MQIENDKNWCICLDKDIYVGEFIIDVAALINTTEEGWRVGHFIKLI